jgi:hypothetical protein
VREDDHNRRYIDLASMATRALGRARAAGATVDPTPLIEVLEARIPMQAGVQRVRVDAAEALAGFAGDQRALAVLRAVLTRPVDEPLAVLTAAASSAGQLGDARSASPLLAVAVRVPGAAPAATSALIALGPPAAEAALAALRGTDPDLVVLARAQLRVDRCDRSRESGGWGTASSTTRCPGPGAIAARAAAVLGGLRTAGAGPLLAAELRKPPMPIGFMADGGPLASHHVDVIAALGRIGGEPVAAELLALAGSEDAEVDARVAALRALPVAGSPATGPVQRLSDDSRQPPAVRAEAARAVALLTSECRREVDCLIAALARGAALERTLLEVGKLGPAGAPLVDAVLAHIGHHDPDVRAAALLAVERITPRPCAACDQALAAAIEQAGASRDGAAAAADYRRTRAIVARAD